MGFRLPFKGVVGTMKRLETRGCRKVYSGFLWAAEGCSCLKYHSTAAARCRVKFNAYGEGP